MGDHVLGKRLVQAFAGFVALGVGLVVGPMPAHAVGEVYGPYYLVNYETAFGPNPQCLADPAASTANNAHQVLFDCGWGGQLFNNETVATNSDYWTFNASNSKCLVPYGGSTSSGAWIVQYDCNNALSLRWAYVDQGYTGLHYCPKFPHTGKQYCQYTVFEIHNMANYNMCIATQNGVVTKNTGLVQYPCNNVTTNWWVQIPA